MRINEIVRLLDYAEDGINGYGRITGIYKNKTVSVSNANQPFQGTLTNKIIPYDRITSQKSKNKA